MQAAEELARGQQQGWAANGAVYEAMVAATCEAGFLDEAIEIVNRMKVCAPSLFMPASPNSSCTVKLVVNTMIRAGWCMPWQRVVSRQRREPCCICFLPRPSHARRQIPLFLISTTTRCSGRAWRRRRGTCTRSRGNTLLFWKSIICALGSTFCTQTTLPLQREGVAPTARHVHPILRTYAAGGSLEYLQEKVLLDVATSADIVIDTECFNCLLRVRFTKRSSSH